MTLPTIYYETALYRNIRNSRLRPQPSHELEDSLRSPKLSSFAKYRVRNASRGIIPKETSMAQSTTTKDSRHDAKEPPIVTETTHENDEQHKDNDTFEFRLFAPPATKPSTVNTHAHNPETTQEPPTPNPSSSSQTQRIRLSTPDTARHQASRQPTRPQEYYIAPAATAAQRAQYAEAAITGEQVRQLANRPCPGLRMPWRVIRLPASAFAPGLLSAARDDNDDDKKEEDEGGDAENAGSAGGRRRRRARKGKKTRLLIRRRVQAGRAREEAAEELARVKAEKIREKTRRVNRKKQLKKRERERERRKTEAGVGSVDGDGLAGGSGRPSE